VKRCVLKFLNNQIAGNTETDIWKYKSQKEVWNEFMIHYKKLIIDSNAKFNQEYTNELEVNKCCAIIEALAWKRY